MRLAIILFSVLTLSACSSLESASKQASSLVNLDSLIGKNWQLSKLVGEDNLSSVFGGGLPSLNFTGDGKVSGSDGCNNFSGAVPKDDLMQGKLDLSSLGSTRKACDFKGPDALNSAFKNASSFSLKDNKLQLLDSAKGLLAEYVAK
jgi:heat shock protein HslJ